MKKLNKKRKAELKRCGAKTILLLLILIVPLSQAQITGTMNLTQEEVYRTESTELKTVISNHVGGTTVDQLKLNVLNQDLDLNKSYSMGELSPGQSWKIPYLEIYTATETPTGKHEIRGYLKYEDTSMNLVTQTLTVKKNPLTLNIELKKEETPRDGNNTLQIEAVNTGNFTLKNVKVDPDFGKLAYLNTEEECSTNLEKLEPGESFTSVCKFQATEESPSEYDLPIHYSFIDNTEEKHEFKTYKQIPVESGINLPGLNTIIIALLIIATFLVLLRRFI